MENSVQKNTRIFIAGHRGLVGQALVRYFQKQGYSDLVMIERQRLDLCNEHQVHDFLRAHHPEVVINAAAKVGGIAANLAAPAEFLETNLRIQLNLIAAARAFSAKRFVSFGSNCMYPANTTQPMKETQLFTGPFEESNAAYATAKMAGLKLAQSYHSQYGLSVLNLIPASLYGPGDNFDLHNSHVMSALIRKFVEAQRQNAGEVIVWGSGRPRREFLFVDDLAMAVEFLLRTSPSAEPINIGSGHDLTIRELAEMIKQVVGFEGNIQFDPSRPDGVAQKLLNSSRANDLGWQAKTPLEEGLRATVAWYLAQG